MKTFKALYIDNGVIKAGEFPVEPELCANRDAYEHVFGLCKCEEKICNYLIEIERAKANAVVCEDQDVAGKMIAVRAPYADFIFPLPPGWDYVEKVRVCTDDCTCAEPCIVRVVAKLYRTTEQPEPEESQEEIFDDLFSQYFKMLHEGHSMCKTGEILRERFTITRKTN